MRNNLPNLRDTVAANVRAELSRSRVSQRDAAQHMSMSQAALSKRLNGYLPFNVDEIALLASLLDLPADLFFADAPRAVSA